MNMEYIGIGAGAIAVTIYAYLKGFMAGRRAIASEVIDLLAGKEPKK